MNNELIREVEELITDVEAKVLVVKDEIPRNKAQGSSWH
ncbi:hypothetical protein IMCC3317_13120 [Kordia antarctica]|uniref:Uncharacterized protein n=1 Tax=Kordia antarctica TaxID=1218801 RepID=A0A7L4ZJ58_9FLAO|nr:hypothetical protein IMCC3317_13120 [Kordia antarctica]